MTITYTIARVEEEESSINGHHIKLSMDQPGKVADPARGLLNRDISPSPFVPENLVSRDGFGRAWCHS